MVTYYTEKRYSELNSTKSQEIIIYTRIFIQDMIKFEET